MPTPVSVGGVSSVDLISIASLQIETDSDSPEYLRRKIEQLEHGTRLLVAGQEKTVSDLKEEIAMLKQELVTIREEIAEVKTNCTCRR